ncbi:chitobiase/beta-hexosaminidase [Leptospira neocaledonica]|uniref:Chitobiase/beta-hexosaminidase n=2 Tax=Leptospira neocaledonica TaxID=2023192 RepID=A0A2N0A0C9_9LEPT|nr:chitobiase/beta-hexosaminidase [Leptospira neocaledonica]
MRAHFLLFLLGFGMLCKPIEVHNPAIPFSDAWWETTFVRCILGELDVCLPGPAISGSLTTKFVSNNPGAISSSDLTWKSDTAGPYDVRIDADSCTSGASLITGTAIANTDNLATIAANILPLGASYIRVCVTDPEEDQTGSGIFKIVRDDTYPTVSTNPTGGAYTSSQNVSILCSDTGGAGCDKIAYVTDTSTPDIDGATGTVNTGTQYSSAINVPANSTTSFKYLARDKAGNVSAVSTSDITVDTVTPTISATNPSDGTTGVALSPGSISLSFAEPMNTGLTMSMTTEIYDGTSWVTIPNNNTIFDWQDSQTLVITVSWTYFPEESQIRWTIPSSSLQDEAGNAVSHQSTFTTTTGATVTGSQVYSGPTTHGTYTLDVTTTDTSTGLVWKTCWEGRSGPGCASGSATNMSWGSALDGCAYLNTIHGPGIGYADRENWRLPRAEELYSLVEGGADPFINTTAFPNPVSPATWTASKGITGSPMDQFARTVVFMYGILNQFDKSLFYAVHCVSD